MRQNPSVFFDRRWRQRAVVLLSIAIVNGMSWNRENANRKLRVRLRGRWRRGLHDLPPPISSGTSSG